MSEQKSAQEKTEEPTKQKKDKARKDGQIARSKELQSAALVVVGGLLLLTSDELGNFANELMYRTFMVDRDMVTDPKMMLNLLGDVGSLAMLAFAPFLLILWIIGIFSGMIPGGPNISMKAIKPKAEKLNPISGLGRMFSKNSLVELGKSVLKVSLLLGIAGLTLWYQAENLIKMNQLSLDAAMMEGLDILGFTMINLGGALLIITLIDVPSQIHSMHQKLRMTKQEVKDENKNNEGSPEIKQKVRQLQMQMSNQQIGKSVPSADVVITNPTHYSVAIKLDLEVADVPHVVAKGMDEIAFRIREVASENNVPIIELPELARSVYYSTRIDQEVPPGLYGPMLAVMRYVYELSHIRKLGLEYEPAKPENFDIPEELKR